MKFLDIWIKHAVINIGCLVGDVKRGAWYKAAECLYHAIVPPQVDHDAETCESIHNGTWSGIVALAAKEIN